MFLVGTRKKGLALLARDWLLEDFGPNLDVEGRSRTDLSQCLQRAYLFIHFSLSLSGSGSRVLIEVRTRVQRVCAPSH